MHISIIYSIVFLGIVFFTILYFYFHSSKKDKIKNIFTLLGISLFQTAIFGLIVYILERTTSVYIIVSDFNDSIFTLPEVGIVFFIIFLITDFLSELFRYIITHGNGFLSFIVFRITLIVLFQLFTLMIIQTILINTGLFSFSIVDWKFNRVPMMIYWGYFFLLILIPQIIIEIIRSLFFPNEV